MLDLLLCCHALASSPVAERAVRFSNSGVELSGTMVVPAGDGPHPALLFLQGSGDHAREPGLHLARELAELGLVGLSYDKRGTGESSGDWRMATLDDLARDAQAGLAFLRAQPGVDPARVGLYAPSQGAWVACRLAELGGAFDFLIAFSGGGVTPLEAERWAYAHMLEDAGLEPEPERRAAALLERYLACLAGTLDSAAFLAELEAARAEPFYEVLRLERNAVMAARRDAWSWVASFDPRAGAERVRGPVLVLLGERDELQPSPLAARRWREALARGGNRDATVRVFPGANHYLRAAPAGTDPHDAPFVAGLEETLAGWLRSRVLAGPRAEPELLVRDVTVVDTEAGALRPHQTVLVRGERIAFAGAAASAPAAPAARVIEGAGRYLMSGLVDAHVHLTERDLPLFLAAGVTAIRELNGSPTHLELRARIATGETLGPRMLVSSPLLAGEPQRWRHVLLRDADAAAEQALSLADEGYDALKVYDGLGGEAYEALEAVARERSLPLVGHVPRAVGLERVLAARQDIEHMNQILQAAGGHALDGARLAAVVADIRRAGVSVTPTLASLEVLDGSLDLAARLARPEVAYVERDTLDWWQSLAPHGGAGERSGPSAWLTLQRELVLSLARAGVPLLVGTDTPNAAMVPGFSIHDELAALVAAGLTRAEVLRAATLGGASRLGLEDLGRVAPGQRADLLLLDGDPLASLETLRHPLGVCSAGRWLDAEALAAALAPLARKD
jgi:dienelactone hydrolase